MAMRIINTKVPLEKDGDRDNAVEFKLPYDFGNDLDHAVKLFGADVVYNRFVAAAVVDFQGRVRRIYRGTKKIAGITNPEVIAAKMAEWKPEIGNIPDPEKIVADTMKNVAKIDDAAKLKALMDTIAAQLAAVEGNAPAKPDVAPAPDVPSPAVPKLVKARKRA